MKKLFLLLLIMAGFLMIYGCQWTPFKDFDVGPNKNVPKTNAYDANIFPLNPMWGKQIEHDTIPNPAESCPIQSDSDNPDDWTKSPQYPSCTSYAVTFNGGIFCGPHVNFMPVTYEGKVSWDDHAFDDDYLLNVKRDDQALYSTAGYQVHIEFNSDETVDNWDDTHTWWDNFHHNGVDHVSVVTGPGGEPIVIPDGKEQAAAMIDGSYVMVTGLLNFDTLHGDNPNGITGGKTELHPVYSMFVQLKGNDVRQSSWAFFVRNWGDQGACGDDDEGLYTRQQQVKVDIPNAAGVTSYNIWDGAQNEDQLSPMTVSAQPYGDGIRLTFTLLPPEKQSWFVGDLTVATRSPLSTSVATTGAAANARTQDAGEPDVNPDRELQARIDRLPASAKKELYSQLQNLIPHKKSFPVKPTILTEPAKVEETQQKSPAKIILHRGLVRASNKSTGKLHRQKRIEFINKYLAEKGVK